ncbi:MAG: hypothetical protein PHI66_00550 [Candidatus Pacebacteria bacterium]|nr:hypothetical protein [Candidatus Paceibacterota bacterium]
MKFPDLNLGYVFNYKSYITEEGIMLTFLGGFVKILFGFDQIREMRKTRYLGGRISWDVLRWGKCPKCTEVLSVHLDKGVFLNHMIVFDDLEKAIAEIRILGIKVD